MPIHLTALQVLRVGLRSVGQDEHVQARRSESTREDDSHSFYGTGPDVASIVFSGLQTTAVAAARVAPDELDLHSHMMALHSLETCPTDNCKSTTFEGSPETCREWCWWHCQKIRMLEESKIVWPTEWDDTGPNYDPDNTPTSLLSVDGVHCRMSEPWHPAHSRDPRPYSHKSRQSGLSYELALRLLEDRLVWMRGPLPAGESDIDTPQGAGGGVALGDRIPDGELGIADHGCPGQRGVLSLPSSHDTPGVRKFKSRARARQETSNARIK